MRIIVAITFLFSLCAGFAQGQRYYDLLDRTEIDPVKLRNANQEKLKVRDFDQQGYIGMMLEELNLERKSRGRPNFIIDSVYAQICNVGVKHFSPNYFYSEKTGYKLLRNTEFGIRYLKGQYRAFNVITFTISLVDLKNLTNFYYLSSDQSTELKLFYGNRPKTFNPEDERYVTPVPLQPINEKEFTQKVIKILSSEMGIGEFFSKLNTHIGLGLRLDPYTLNCRKMPTAFGMIILGGKQTQKVKIKLPPTSDKELENDPFVILKD